MEALPKAVEIWNDPGAMIAEWERDESKRKHENLVGYWVGRARSVADLGCGAGRYAKILDYSEYLGMGS